LTPLLLFFTLSSEECGARGIAALVGGQLGVRVVMAEQQKWGRAVVLSARSVGAVILGALVVIGLLGAAPAAARRGHIPARADSGPVFAWILLEADTGQVFSEQNADAVTYPASLTKMMTLYLVFEALNQGRIRLEQSFVVSADAAARSPSRLGLTPGESVPLRDLILGVITRSANDAAAVIAENLAGSESNFARYMTWKARQLGMQHTVYQNASGLPNPDQRTTARDTARLALALYQQFPREYRYFATREFDFRGDQVKTHNHLLEWYQGADGIKTGFVNASGFNLAASAVRDGRRLVGVIMGGRSARTRDAQMGALLDQGFAVLASGRPIQPQGPALVARAAPTGIVAAAPVAAPAVAVQTPVQTVVAGPIVDSASAGRAAAEAAPPRPDGIGKVASAALRHLAPMSKAQAATAVHQAPAAPTEDRWGIQLGAFSGEAAAEQALRRAAGLPLVRGKQQQVLAPAKSGGDRLYRARLFNFTEKGAQAACAELKRRGMACSVVRAGGVKVARG
jgi:D-alanyl-D-alanine carboxypeptidase